MAAEGDQRRFKLASDPQGTAMDSRAMPKNMRTQNRIDGLDSLARMGDEVAARLAEHDQDGLEHGKARMYQG